MAAIIKSSALKTIGVTSEREKAAAPFKWTFSCPKKGRYRIFVASDRALRDRATSLVSRVYQKQGYLLNNEEYPHLNNTDTKAQIFTLLVEDAEGEDAGTVSLIPDARRGLPCDEIFGEQTDALRMHGQRLAEVTGLVIAAKHTRSKVLLVHLMNFILIAARRICRSTTVVIEVNPRHENFYRRSLNFEEAGPVRACHRVRGAPARLLSLDLALQREAVRAEAGLAGAATARQKHSLYTHFYPLEEEVFIARFLKRSALCGRPFNMTKGRGRRTAPR